MKLRIATYNVENLFEQGIDTKTRAARRALARMIDIVNADVLMLQEVGSKDVLDGLNQDLKNAYAYVGLKEGNSTRSIHLGVLSRIKMTLKSHVHIPLYDKRGEILRGFATEQDALNAQQSQLRLQRDVLRSECDLGGFRFAFFSVHLKSKWSPPWADVTSDDLREAEARCVTRVIVDYRDEHPDVHIVLLGDFNDVASSDAMAPVRRLDFIDPHKQWFQTMGRNPTTYWPRRKKRIDRIYLSPETADLVVPGSQTVHAGEMAKQASDHYPVSIELELPGDRVL